MRTNLLALIALAACSSMIASCAAYRPVSSAATASPAAPRLAIPPAAAEPCALHLLPPAPSQADLEVGYQMRGQALAVCDGKRQLAVDTAEAQGDLLDRWEAALAAQRERRSRPWWRFWGGRA